jgi:hypothetical protein
VPELELLVRTVLHKSASALVGVLLQQAADRSDAPYQAKSGEQRKGQETLQVQWLFGAFPLGAGSLLPFRQRPGALFGRCRAGFGGGLRARLGLVDLSRRGR